MERTGNIKSVESQEVSKKGRKDVLGVRDRVFLEPFMEHCVFGRESLVGVVFEEAAEKIVALVAYETSS